MKIIITKHFEERVKERYQRDYVDKLDCIIKRFKEAQESIRKKQFFFKITEKIWWLWHTTYKIYVEDLAYVYSKKNGEYTLITLWVRNTIKKSIFSETLKNPNSEKIQDLKKIQIQKKSKTKKIWIPKSSKKCKLRWLTSRRMKDITNP